MATIPLPVNESADANGALIEVTNTTPAQFGIMGNAYGNDPYGDTAVGVVGQTDVGIGVQGSAQSGQGVVGGSGGGTGVYGISDGGSGVFGQSFDGPGVYGQSTNDWGVVGVSQSEDAINGTTAAPQHAGVSANNTAPAGGGVPSGFGLWASSNNTALFARGTPAGYFDGDVLVTGDVILANSSSGDIAEDFDVEDHRINTEPGAVLTINDQGKLAASTVPYDTRVAGIVAGGGELRPALVLQRVPSTLPRLPIALLGKTFCKVDATYGPISAGDLLTTSGTPGHAMRVSDRFQALGAIVGKALASLTEGRGVIPIMVSLR